MFVQLQSMIFAPLGGADDDAELAHENNFYISFPCCYVLLNASPSFIYLQFPQLVNDTGGICHVEENLTSCILDGVLLNFWAWTVHNIMN